MVPRVDDGRACLKIVRPDHGINEPAPGAISELVVTCREVYKVGCVHEDGLNPGLRDDPDEPVAIGRIEPPDRPPHGVPREDLGGLTPDLPGVFGRSGEVPLFWDVDSEAHGASIPQSAAPKYITRGFSIVVRLAKWYNLPELTAGHPALADHRGGADMNVRPVPRPVRGWFASRTITGA